MEESQLTQPATQTVLDPRRLGKQNSGFSDEDISDIICLLLPYTDNARAEVARIGKTNPHFVVGKDDADQLDLDYSTEDVPERFGSGPTNTGKLAIALRLSAKVKSPLQGFTFGRNAQRCDFPLENDPYRRLSNVHFRIYINEYGVLMLEDQSTNGTIVDHNLLKARSKDAPHPVRRTLNSGTRISLLSREDAMDLAFLVRVPRREGDYETAYRKNLVSHLAELRQLAEDHEQTITAGPGGHVDLFPQEPQRRPMGMQASKPERTGLNQTTQQYDSRVQRDWNGSAQYNRIGPIGKGAFATVHKVTDKFNGLPYAAKELDKKRFMKNGVLDQKVDNEMKIMQRIQHPNIVQYIEHFEWEDRLLIIIMEYVPGGDLGRFVETRGPLSEDAVKIMAKQLLEALAYLHENNITHRDVKPDNILIESQSPLVVKLTDFGLSKIVDNDDTFLRTFCGTLLYCAPEVYSEYKEYDEHGRRNPRNKNRRSAPGQRYNHAIDVWSLGGVLWYCLTGQPPFPVAKGTSYTELLYQIMTHGVDMGPVQRAGISDHGQVFLQEMLQTRPEARSTVEELLNHPWLGGASFASSQEAISDEALQFKASQLSLVENRQTIIAPLSDDEILDDEDDFDDLKFLQSDSQKENATFGAPPQAPRLFGEVNVSAIGSSGVIPEDRLNLPVSNGSLGQTEFHSDSEIGDSFESQLSSIPKAPGTQNPASGGAQSSANKSHSVDELNNLTFDVSSQSLGGAESILGNLHMKSAPETTTRRSFNGLNTSKRKPSFDMSDERVDVPSAGKPTFKRLRSEGRVEVIPDLDDEDDDLLLVDVPSISRERSARQIDTPVNKSVYWTPGDTTSYHLRYPEMTQLQHEAFVRGALARNEQFRPGKSALWKLAMKYFPPAGRATSQPPPVVLPDDGPYDPSEHLASTDPEPPPSSLLEEVSNPGWKQPSVLLDGGTAVPPKSQNSPKRVVASLESAPGSGIPGLLIPITESTTSWGRGPKNTRIYPQRMDTRVSKCALKILLWKEGFDPSKDIRPWNRPTVADEKNFHFYISTKATEGIRVNGIELRSHDHKNAMSASKFWIKLFDGDVITIWRNVDQRMSPGRLVFHCAWGGSAQQRPETSLGDLPPPPLVPDAITRRLDEACLKTEKRIFEQSEQQLQMDEANVDYEERQKNIDLERHRSVVFEARRAQAVRSLSTRGGSTATAGRLLAVRTSTRVSPGWDDLG